MSVNLYMKDPMLKNFLFGILGCTKGSETTWNTTRGY